MMPDQRTSEAPGAIFGSDGAVVVHELGPDVSYVLSWLSTLLPPAAGRR
jgi:hypothetical protein